MNIDEVVALLENYITTLRNNRALLYLLGDLESIIKIDTNIEKTETLITQLKAL